MTEKSNMASVVVEPSKVGINRSLVLVQSKLSSPNFQSGGRWAFVNVDTRKSLLAVGKDRVPPILFALLSAASSSDSVTTRPIADVRTLDILRQNKLLLIEESAQKAPVSTVASATDLYHRYVWDYEFADYATPGWRERDHDRMVAYEAVEHRPPLFTDRAGARHSLPEIDTTVFSGTPQTLSLDNLSYLLKIGFGATSFSEEGSGQWMRKTSPSGGARHPTDAMVSIPGHMGPIAPGLYYYDPASHSLIEAEDGRLSSAEYREDTSGQASFVQIMLLSRVERAMWRYRDCRSFRAIAIDAGHVLETLCLVAEGMRLCVKTHTKTAASDCLPFWLHEPELCSVIISTDDLRMDDCLKNGLGARLDRPVLSQDFENAWPPEQEWVTTPFLFISFAGGMLGNVVWPARTRCAIDLDDFRILEHCIPSSRADRPNTTTQIVMRFDVDSIRIRKLVENGLLIPRELFVRLAKGVARWVDKNWYIALLCIAEGRASTEVLVTRGRPESRIPLYRRDIEIVSRLLLTRTTTRRFAQRPLSANLATLVLGSVEQLKVAFEISIAAVCLSRVEGSSEGSVLFVAEGRTKFACQNRLICRETLQLACAGQTAPVEASIVIWLIQKACPEEPDKYLPSLTKLGQAGQSLCLKATELGLGVFVSPAVRDSLTSELLTDEIHRDWIPYVIAIGFPEGLRSLEKAPD